MNNIGIIGAGDIGFNLAEILALKRYNVTIYNRYHSVDDKPSPYWLSKLGKIMDMNDSLQLPGCLDVVLTYNIYDLKNSDIIVITSGTKRTSPEETREELAGKNAKIIENYVNLLSDNPNILSLVVSNPVDFLNQFLIEEIKQYSGREIYDVAKKIVGVSYVDSMRLKHLIKEAFPIDNIDSDIFAIGEHGPSMVPLIDSLIINGKSIESLLTREQIENIRQDTISRGNDIIKLTGASSVLGPAHAAMYMIDEITKNKEAIIPASVWDGNRSIGRVARFTNFEFDSIINTEMSDKEIKMLKLSEQHLDNQYRNIMRIIK